ncbi:MAG: hypothetical protein E7641_07405 [Ruminococcaceae bacterium]|nr:hypothetical protein [Oscillospiraceae bacterium]
MKKRRSHTPMSVGAAIFLTVVGLMLGTVFIFGNRYWSKPIQKSDAIQLTANYEGYEIRRGFTRNTVKQIKIVLSDGSAVNVDGACVSDEVKVGIEELPKGTTLKMLVHPNSSIVWELKQGGRMILPFEEAQKDIKNENTGFAFLGAVMYFCSACGLCSLFMRWIRARKRKKVR